MLNRPFAAEIGDVDAHDDHPPAVHCLGCGFAWRSRAMAEGLRLLGSCPKCGGELGFAESAPARDGDEMPAVDLRAPHLVLGVPRR
jgi:hypothetical protein